VPLGAYDALGVSRDRACRSPGGVMRAVPCAPLGAYDVADGRVLAE
jgi:hypothetical protein